MTATTPAERFRMAAATVEAQRKTLSAMSTTLSIKSTTSARLMDTCMQIVCKAFEMTPEDIKGPCREKEYAYARHTYCYLCINLDPMLTLKKVGETIGRDHSTIINSIKKCEQLRTSDMRYAKQFNACLDILQEAHKNVYRRLNEDRINMMRSQFQAQKHGRESNAITIVRKFMDIMQNPQAPDEVHRTLQELGDLYLDARVAGF